MKSFLSHFYRLWRLQALLVFVQAGLVGLVYLTFFKENVTLVQLFIGEFIASTIVSLYILLRGRFFARADIQIGFLLVIVAFLLLLLPFSSTLYYVYASMSGLASMTFFIPYNIQLFHEKRKGQSVQDMTWYWGVSIIVAILGPIIGAYILTLFGIKWFIVLATCIALLGVIFASHLKNQKYIYSPKETLTHIAGLRTIVSIDGGLHRIMRVVPFFGLLYISREIDYGLFLSIMSVVSFIVALQMAKVSDQKKKRLSFIFPLSFVAGLLTAGFSFVHSITSFIIMALLLKGVTVMVEPLRGHVMMDAKKNDPIGWISREFYLNFGRACVMGYAALMLGLGYPSLLFVGLGVLHMSFPMVLLGKKVYARDH